MCLQVLQVPLDVAAQRSSSVAKVPVLHTKSAAPQLAFWLGKDVAAVGCKVHAACTFGQHICQGLHSKDRSFCLDVGMPH